MDGEGKGKLVAEELRPPRLENAGLEDCALPLEAITEAFFKAANSVSLPSCLLNSRDCVDDPDRTNDGDFHDSPISDSQYPVSFPMPCGGSPVPVPMSERGSSRESCGGKPPAFGDGEGSSDLVLGVKLPQVEEGRPCVDGLLQGLEIREKGDKGLEGKKKIEEEEEDGDDVPILAEACI